MPVSLQNVSALMHPSVAAQSRYDEIKSAVDELIRDALVPFGEKDGSLCFFSEKLNDIEQERAGLPLRTVETRRIQNEALRELFSPLPSTRLEGSLVISTGVKLQTGSLVSSLAGRSVIQCRRRSEFVDSGEYDNAKAQLIEESRQRSSQNTVFLLGRVSPDAEQKISEIYRCQEIAQRYRSDPDQEVRDYCTAQLDRAATLSGELEAALRKSLINGSFIFQADQDSVSDLDQDLLEASKKHLKKVASRVFDRYQEAPVRVETTLIREVFAYRQPQGHPPPSWTH